MKDEMTVVMANGERRKLNSPAELRGIDPDREAMFVFRGGDAYTGYCDGVINSYGNFYIEGTVCISNHPINSLKGWCYLQNY